MGAVTVRGRIRDALELPWSVAVKVIEPVNGALGVPVIDPEDRGACR